MTGPIRASADLRASQMVLASGAEISQAVLNLLLNAIEAVEEKGSGDIILRTRDETGQVVLEISDTGVGIAPGEEQKLFAPLHTTKASHSGLGLAVSYRIAEWHRGELTYSTRAGEGSTFRLALPTADASQA